MRMTWLGLMVCAAMTGIGCGDDGDGGSGSPATGPCYDVCTEQAAAETAGSCELLSLSDCKLLCDAVTSQGECLDEFTAMNECWLTGSFSCGLFSAESDADCATQNAAYQQCGNAGSAGNGGGGSAAACTGADDSGRCPAVTCPCADGEQMISGSETDASGCSCLDTTTCLDLCF